MNTENLNMKPDAKRVAALFQAALQLSGNARASFLESACNGDGPLRQRLDALLAADEQSEGVLAEPALAANATKKIAFAEVPDETIGQKIGRYKILERVGEGGCGVVYVAEQTEPVRRRVALKVIKLGMDTKQVVARFEAERQALAMMDHPNIAKVLDAGATETGRPYFVMELVRGIRITDYCDQNNLSTKERLDLFIKVCQAIQHAHQKGIIHRDIKPSNILVTLHDGVPVPKVIDFGIAKATTDQRLTDKTIYTQLQQFVGTPAYMSPEQAEMSGLDIDTRCDIYGLGVLLYELLTGRTPFDTQELMSQGIDAMRRTIREREPERPSTKLATLKGDELTTTAKRRSIESSRLANLLRGDLDWIVMKCLEKDRTRRYETANGLAFDLKRHLNNETVLARPPSSAYRFQRLVRRNKLTFAAIGAVALALVLGIIATTWQAILATQAKQAALAAQASEKIQRQQAMANEKEAVTAQKAEAEEELVARQRAYASDMNLAMQALNGSNLGRALDLLNRQRPIPGQKDLRGWEWRYLWQQTRSDALFTLCQESNEIESLAASADGQWLAFGVMHKGGVFVYDLHTRQQVAQLAADNYVTRATFSPAESLLAFASSKLDVAGKVVQTSLHLWDATKRQMIAQFPLDDACTGLAFSNDGRTLVTSTEGGRITLWHMPEGTKLASYLVTDQYIIYTGTGFATTSNLNLAASAYGEEGSQRVRVIDLRNGKQLWHTAFPKTFITALAFSPDGKILATAAGFNESDIHLWDTATGQEIGSLKGHHSWVSSLVFWPDGKKLASASADQTVRIWDMASRKCLDVLHGHRLEVWRLALLPDGKTLVSGAKDGTVCFWDTSVTHPREPRSIIPIHENVYDWNFSPDSQSVLTVDYQHHQVVRWSGPGFQQQERFLDPGTHFSSDEFSQDGRFLAFGFTNGVLQVWDVSRRVLLRQWTNTTDNVWTVTFLANGNKLITWSKIGNSYHEWDLPTGRELQSWREAVPNSKYIAADPYGDLNVEIGFEGAVHLKDAAHDEDLETNLDYLEGVGAAVSPDGKFLSVATHLGYARVWDTATWHEEATLSGFLNAVCSVAFSPDGQRLATGGANPDDAVKLWDVASWQDLFTLDGEGSLFDGSAFSPDGNVIAAQSADRHLNIWRAPSWAEINAAEAKDSPSPGYASTGNVDAQ
jgi:WD40 repeat protein/serine/threonine protein kinase